MKLERRTLAISGFAVLLALAVAACNNPNTPPSTLNAGSMTADLQDGSGNTIFFNSASALVSQGSDYTVDAKETVSGSSNEIGLTIPVESNVPYSLAAPPNTTVEIRFYDASNGQHYIGNVQQGSAQVSVSANSPTLQGAFSGRLVAKGIADSVRVLTNGAFNASF